MHIIYNAAYRALFVECSKPVGFRHYEHYNAILKINSHLKPIYDNKNMKKANETFAGITPCLIVTTK